MKILILSLLLLTTGCASLGVASEAFVTESLTALMADVDARVAAGEEFDAALDDEVSKLKGEVAAKAESILPGLLGDQLPVGGGILGAIALWILRNKTRQKSGIASTLLTGLPKPPAA